MVGEGRELLEGVGLRFEVESVPTDESVRAAEAPLSYVERMARTKLEIALAHFTHRDESTFVLTADTIVLGAGLPPARTPLSEHVSRELKGRGFKFCGPTIVYAWMQATGLVDDHAASCFRRGATT